MHYKPIKPGKKFDASKKISIKDFKGQSYALGLHKSLENRGNGKNIRAVF